MSCPVPVWTHASRSLFLQVTVSLSCLLLAIWLYNDKNYGDRICFQSFPVDRWFITVAAVAPIYGVSRILSSLLLMLSEFVFEHLQHVHYVILGLWWPLTCEPSAACVPASACMHAGIPPTGIVCTDLCI